MSSGRVECQGFESYRHGTLSLSAVLNARTGQGAGGKCPPAYQEAFVSFLEQVVGGCKPKQEIHIILDNLSRTHDP
jgi:hypothetical protein